ncbi:MAG: hypothetical protein WC284_08195 [Candidimonas sp.]
MTYKLVKEIRETFHRCHSCIHAKRGGFLVVCDIDKKSRDRDDGCDKWALNGSLKSRYDAATDVMKQKWKLTPNDIVVGGTYRGHRPKQNPFTREYDDRHVLFISKDGKKVQYDSISVGIGRHYPTIDIEQFLGWAKEKVV